MSNEHKTHYRKVFKSDHLGIADLEDFIESGHNLVFTIKAVRQEVGAKVAGRKIDANIAYFHENIKPLVLNATNSKTMSKLTGSSFVEDWHDVAIQLYIDKNVRMKGETVGGVRVSPNPVQRQKPLLTPDNAKMWESAKKAFVRDGNFSSVLERAEISEKHMEQIMQEVSNA